MGPSSGGYFHAQHEKTRSKSCQWTMASSTKKSAWCRASVRVQRTARRTHREHPVKLPVLNGCRAAESESSSGAERTCHADAVSNMQGTGDDEQRSLRTAPKGTQRRPSSELPLPAAPPAFFAALRRTRRHRSTAHAAMRPQPAPLPPHRPVWRPRDRAAVLAAARIYPSVARATSARAEEL